MKRNIKIFGSEDVMTVSLCVIAYNEEEMISGLLEDISMQTYPHNLTEIIFVDNGSTDTTPAQLSAFEKQKEVR